MRRPLLVLVSGHPGAGKTTLGRALGDHLRLPHLNRDRLRDGLSHTDPAEPLDQPRMWQVFLATITLYLDNGISLVADQTLYPGMVEDLTRLRDHGDLVNVHCRCPHAYDRWVEKSRLHPGFAEVDERVRRQRDEFTDPLDLGAPVIEVETTDGYDPSIDRLCALIAGSRS